ncbi:unnamed protein product [Calypogeia fissa]
MGQQLTTNQKQQMKKLIKEYQDCFAFSMKELGKCNIMEFTIPLTDETPIFRKRHRLSQHEWELVDARCKELHEAGLIRPSSSPFAAPTVMPAKKDSSGLWSEKRMCGDYRALNQVTQQDRYPVPTPEEIFDTLGKSRYFSILDLRQGFNQIIVAEKDRRKTTFHGSDKLWEWLYMPFGTVNAAIFFQKVMNIVKEGASHIKCYIDDVMVHSPSFVKHLDDVEDLFKRLRKANLKCHPKKCEFGVTTIVYLGHRVIPNGLMLEEAKVLSISSMKAPTDVNKLRIFLGLCNYYRTHVEQFSTIANPLNQFLKKDTPWCWIEERQAAFDKLKQVLMTHPVLRRPNFSIPFILHTNWSAIGLSAILGQQDQGEPEYVVVYASCSNNKAESNYSSYEGELLAVEYNFEVIHRPGVTHQNADAMSRSPLGTSDDHTVARQDFDSMVEPTATSCLALSADVQVDEATSVDIWKDNATLHYIQRGEFPPNVTLMERDRIQHRARIYSWKNNHLVRLFPSGDHMVPPVLERPALIQKIHSELGYFGIKRTHNLLAPHFSWRGMYTQVRDVLARCVVCDRVKSSFSDRQMQLRPLPIQGLFYRWPCDLAGELPITPRGNIFVMIMIEHFSKWIELVPLRNKTYHSTSQAFLQRVLRQFGACAECLTDQGTEFRGEFQDLLDHALIDHRRTSRDHPQADGLAERMVQTCKKGLRKTCLTKNKSDWDLQLPYIAMGYRMSKHASLSTFSPYFLLFRRHPVPPSAIAPQMDLVVDLDNEDVWAQVVSDRATLFKRVMPMAM